MTSIIASARINLRPTVYTKELLIGLQKRVLVYDDIRMAIFSIKRIKNRR